MQKNKYSAQYPKLSNLILNLSVNDQEMLLKIASGLHKGKIKIIDSDNNIRIFTFASGILAGASIVILFLSVLNVVR